MPGTGFVCVFMRLPWSDRAVLLVQVANQNIEFLLSYPLAKPASHIIILFNLYFQGLVAIAGFDLAGLIFRWQFFDHAAHLGGVLFGG